MGVYIKGMEMPKRGHTITITIVGSGQAYVEYFDCRPRAKETIEYTAVPGPPHGMLIDEDALWVEINKICDRRDAGIISDLTCLQQLLSAVRHAPTIIPAEEGE